MIYTLTLNPAIDYYVETPALKLGEVNRGVSSSFRAGGKGINVSRALSRLEAKNKAVAFKGRGFAGDLFKALTEDLNRIFILTEADTRINVKAVSENETTEINANFPVTESEMAELTDTLDEIKLKIGDLFVMAGSLPSGINVSFYADMVNRLNSRGLKTVVDASGEALKRTISESFPFLIKPNLSELRELSGKKINTFEEAISCARKFNNFNCQNVLVSFGVRGAVLITEKVGLIRETSDDERTAGGYAVGAGDTLLAGFAAEYDRTRDLEKALNFGVGLACKYVKGEF